MNSGVIIKIEYRLLGEQEFTEMDFEGFSGKISKNTSKPSSGILHSTTINLMIPKITNEKTSELDGLLNRKAQYQVTDSNGKVHLVGDDNFPARLFYQNGIDGTPGSWNGYTASITHKSPYSYPIS